MALFDRNAVLLEQTAQEFAASGVVVRTYTVDISQEEQVKQAVEQTVSDFGQLDVVVHSAGIVGPTSTNITAYATADFEKLLAVNLFGSFLITKYTVGHMASRQYGRILLIASIAGKEGNPGMVGYSVSKAGVIGLVKAIAKEYATAGITVNGLAPAVIRTAMNADTAPEQLAYMTAKIPMGRLGETDEVAAMACFIVSPPKTVFQPVLFTIFRAAGQRIEQERSNRRSS